MKLFSKWPWFRGRSKPVRRRPIAPRARLVVEVLEDRLALSAIAPSLTHDQWRLESFSLGEVAVADPQQVLNPQNIEASAMQGSSLIGLDRVFASYPYRGDNYTVAVIDTGIDYNHAALGGGWGRRVIGGWDFVNNDADPMDDHGHGTHVAGIIGSSNGSYTGIAPNVKFVALKVLGANGSGTFAAVEDALQWVSSHQAQYNIVAVNLSLGAGNYASDPYGFLDSSFAALKNKGVFIAAAAGNSFYSYNSQQGLGYPAISNYAVAVGAVWTGDFGAIAWSSGARDYTTAADRVTSFTQRSAALDIFAPGALVTSSYLGGGWATMAGTSMAAPMVAGAAAILHQALDATGHASQANQDYILSLMQSTGATIRDGDDENDNVSNTGLTFKRLNLYGALGAIPPSNGNQAPVLAAIANQTVSRGAPSLTVSLSYSDPNGDAVRLSARGYTATGSAVLLSASVASQQLTLQRLGAWPSSFIVEVTASDGAAQVRQTFTVTLVNNAPTLAALADQTMVRSQGSVTVNLVYGDADGDALLFQAQARGIPSQAYQLKQQLGLSYPGSYYQNHWGMNEKWMTGSGNQWYCILANGQLRRWGGSASATLQAGNLIATLDASFYAAPSQLWNAAAPVVPVVACRFQGHQLVVTPASGYVGSFYVDVTVSDGFAAATRSFTVTVVNNAPTLAAIADQTMHTGSLTLDLAGSDADGDALLFQAQARAVPSQAYQLKQQLGLSYPGSYYQNHWGMKEKWMTGSGNQWYCILANGQLRRWGGSASATLQAGNLIATLDASFYADPSKLWNAAPPVVPVVAFAFQGQQLVVTPANGYVGSFYVDVTVRDGFAATSRSFTVTVVNNAPTLAAIADQTMHAGSLTLDLAGSDADGDALLFQVQARAVPSQAYQLKQQLGLSYPGSYYQNHWGMKEKWMTGSGNQWYCILANGQLRRWGGSASATLQANNLITTLDASFYADPRQLWNAQPPVDPTVLLTVEGNRLTIYRPSGYIGTFQVVVTVSDSVLTTTRTFLVTGGG